MTHLVVLIVDDPENCGEVLEAWEAIGVTGVTILESSGLGRLRKVGLRDDLPLMPSIKELFESEEVRHRTLLSVVDDDSKVDKMIAEAQRIIGDLDEADTGFLFVVPVIRAYGLGRKQEGPAD
jgi:nitrogen regulatory protein PII